MRWTTAWATATCGALLLAAGPAAGAETEAQAAARARGEEGLRLFQEGKWESAYAAFARADGLFHAPTLVLFMANCRRSAGRLVEARALYERVVGEPVPPNAPDQFKKAQAAARHELDALAARIGKLEATVTGPGAEQARVSVDGAPATTAELAAGKPIDPGDHVLVAETDSAAGRATVTIADGATARVDIALVPLARPWPRAPLGIAFGVGGAGLVAGAVTGALALTKIHAAHAGCTDEGGGTWRCPASHQASNTAAASAARTLMTVEAVGFAVGGAGVVAGVVLAIVRPGAGKGADKAGASLDVGPTWIGVKGRF
jgi:hypothetical protein